MGGISWQHRNVGWKGFQEVSGLQQDSGPHEIPPHLGACSLTPDTQPKSSKLWLMPIAPVLLRYPLLYRMQFKLFLLPPVHAEPLSPSLYLLWPPSLVQQGEQCTIFWKYHNFSALTAHTLPCPSVAALLIFYCLSCESSGPPSGVEQLSNGHWLWVLMTAMFIVLLEGWVLWKRCRWVLFKIKLGMCFRRFWLDSSLWLSSASWGQTS